MSWARELWERSREAAGRCLEHPFVQGLGDGTLSRARYDAYVAQDAVFLDAFARAYAAGLARAPDREAMRELHRLLSGVFEEQRLHERIAAERGLDLGRVGPLPACRAYADFVLSVAFGGTLGELFAAMTPCMRLYRFLGEELRRRDPAPTYRSWVETYAAEEFAELVVSLERLLDRHAARTGREAANYAYALDLEYAFFDAAWNAAR